MPFKETSRYKLDYAEGPTKVSEWPTLDAQQTKLIDEVMNEVQDFLQGGVVGSTSWEFTAAIKEATGELESSGEVVESTAWLPESSGSKLMRSVTAKAAIAAKLPSALPVEGKFMPIAFELAPTTWNKGATVSVHSGTERATAKEAEEKPPAAETGKIQIRLVIMEKAGGKYKITSQKDLRAGASRLVRQPSAGAASFASWASCETNGTIRASSGDFTFVKSNGTGEYEFAWAKAKTSEWYALCVTLNGGVLAKGFGTIGTSSDLTHFTVRLYNFKGELQNEGFNVVAFATA